MIHGGIVRAELDLDQVDAGANRININDLIALDQLVYIDFANLHILIPPDLLCCACCEHILHHGAPLATGSFRQLPVDVPVLLVLVGDPLVRELHAALAHDLGEGHLVDPLADVAPVLGSIGDGGKGVRSVASNAGPRSRGKKGADETIADRLDDVVRDEQGVHVGVGGGAIVVDGLGDDNIGPEGREESTKGDVVVAIDTKGILERRHTGREGETMRE